MSTIASVITFELDENNSIVEINVPKKFIGQTIGEIQLGARYHLLALTTIKQTTIKSAVGETRRKDQIQGLATADTLLQKGDSLVVFGLNSNIEKFIKD